MPRSPLLLPSGVPRYVLKSAQELLRWVYKNYERAERCQLDFLAWFIGRHTYELIEESKQLVPYLLNMSATWPWLKMQEWMRNLVEQVFADVDRAPRRGLLATRRVLTTQTDHSGRRVLRWGPTFPIYPEEFRQPGRAGKKGRRGLLSTRDDPRPFLAAALDEQLCDLNRVAREALSQCPICMHYFIRALAGRGTYCSTQCRNKALHRPPRKRRTGKGKSSARSRTGT